MPEEDWGLGFRAFGDTAELLEGGSKLNLRLCHPKPKEESFIVVITNP